MDFSYLFDAEILKQFLSESVQSSLGEKLIVLAIVWQLMGKQVARHFSSLEKGMADGFTQLTAAIGEVKDTLSQVEMSHSKKIEDLKLRVERLEKDDSTPISPV